MPPLATHRSLFTAMLVASALAAGAATPGPARAGSPCADLSASASPGIVRPGELETISGSVTNCSEQTETVTVGVRLSGPCGFALTRRFEFILQPGQTLGRSLTFPAPACEGLYAVKARVFSEGVLLDRTEAAFKVCQNCQAN